jgi:hypothetical protein
MRKNPRVPKELPMNGCYSLFSVAMMTAACAGASRQIPAEAAGNASAKQPATEPKSAPLRPLHPEPRSLAFEDSDERTIRDLRQAQGLFETFIAKAGDDPKYVEAVERSRERIEDIRVEIAFLEQGLAERQGSGPY